MFVFTPPNVSQQNTVVTVAQANPATHGVSADLVIGVCEAMPTFQTLPPANEQGEYGLSPLVSAQNYFEIFEHKAVAASGSVTILSKPKHGSLIDEGDGDYTYLPDSGYIGKDGTTFLVDINAQKIKIVHFFHVTDGPVEGGRARPMVMLLITPCARMVISGKFPNKGQSELSQSATQPVTALSKRRMKSRTCG